MSEALDFTRHAPERPQLAWSNDALIEADDLATALLALRRSLRTIALAFRVILAITGNRIRDRFDAVMHSLTASWAIAGAGWGLAIGLAATLYFVR